MCGRAYHTYTDEELALRYQNLDKKTLTFSEIRPSYNLAPTQRTPIVLMRKTTLVIEPMRFGLVPYWAKTLEDASRYQLINAKGEEITEKKTYQSAFKTQRCIVPLSGFFEWQKTTSGKKKPFAIHFKTGSIMSVAGIWEFWKSKIDSQEILSFSIVTTSANSLMKTIHQRMPVILDPKDEEAWIDPENQEANRLKEMLKPCPSEWLVADEISTLVNHPKNNLKDILKPARILTTEGTENPKETD